MRKSLDRASLAPRLLLAGCTVGPNYQRPAIQTPAMLFARRLQRPPTIQHRWPISNGWRFSRTRSCRSWNERRWRRTTICATPSLASRRRAPISASRDPISFRTWAPARISPPFGSRGMEQTPLPASFVPSQNRTFGAATLNLLSFEVDIWGRLRRATEAARANLLSAEENRKAVMTTLVSDVASAYFSLRELDYQLEISQRTLATRQDSLDLIKNRQAGGVATLLDLRQGEQLVYTASETIPTLAAADRADRESDQPAAGEESRRGRCADGASPNRRCRRTCPPVCLPRCWSAGRTFARRSRT